jgi:hypothetical protein
MAKIKLHRLHKIKIHKNRWLIWALAYVLFVGIAMTGYLKVSDINFDTSLSADSTLQAQHSYTDARLGFGVRYPADWSIQADSAQSITFFPSDNASDGITVSVADPASEKSIRKALNIWSEDLVNIGTTPAAKIINNLGKGHYETVILAPYNHKLYVLRGNENLVGRMLLTFHFL